MAIHPLPPDVAAQIAAGEVIERPASVVKELIENSLDAGASRIDVTVEGGGGRLIRVVDDGEGIRSEEVELAFQRHATSKLRSFADLGKLRTMGFRGEALPSIAAVGRVSLLTSTRDAVSGTSIEVLGSAVRRDGLRAMAPGTIVTVTDLFSEIPARRKFLRSASIETTKIHEVVSRLILARPDVHFILRADNRILIAAPGTGEMTDATVAVYGSEVARELLHVGSELNSWGRVTRVEGLVSPPHVSKGNRGSIAVFINGRCIQNRSLSFAVIEAYEGLLPRRRYPVATLNITVPGSDVDVNVHPAKSEVRLDREREVFGLIQRGVREALVAQSQVPSISIVERHPKVLLSAGAEKIAVAIAGLPMDIGSSKADLKLGGGPLKTLSRTLPVLRVMGQLQTTYIVAEGPDGMYLIDQHAAHERVLFDRILDSAGTSRGNQQGLLEPLVVELNSDEQTLLAEVHELLEGSGFLLEPFGPATWLLRAVPAVLNDSDFSQSVHQALEAIRIGESGEDPAIRLNASLACHGSVRAGQALALEEMRDLVRQLEMATRPQTCPHGRPTVVHVSTLHLERQFGRR